MHSTVLCIVLVRNYEEPCRYVQFFRLSVGPRFRWYMVSVLSGSYVSVYRCMHDKLEPYAPYYANLGLNFRPDFLISPHSKEGTNKNRHCSQHRKIGFKLRPGGVFFFFV